MSTKQRWRHAVWAVALCALTLCGCQRTLFPKSSPRTQFDNYDIMRNRYTPLEKPDVFGNPQPALRERLTQR